MITRLDWQHVRSFIEQQTGLVLAAEPVTEGLNSEIAVIVHTNLGATFVKGLRSDHRRVWTQQREAEINPYLGHVAPRLRWHVEGDGWNLLRHDLETTVVAEMTESWDVATTGSGAILRDGAATGVYVHLPDRSGFGTFIAHGRGPLLWLLWHSLVVEDEEASVDENPV